MTAAPKADLPLGTAAERLAADAGEAAPSRALTWLSRAACSGVVPAPAGASATAWAVSAANIASSALRGALAGLRAAAPAASASAAAAAAFAGTAQEQAALLHALTAVVAALSPPLEPLSAALDNPLDPAAEAACERFAAAAEPRVRLLSALCEAAPPPLLLPAAPERTQDGGYAPGCAAGSPLALALAAVTALRVGWGAGDSAAGSAPPWSTPAAASAAAEATTVLASAFAAACGKGAAPAAEQEALLFALASEAPRLRNTLAASAEATAVLGSPDALRAAQTLRAAVCALRHPAAGAAVDATAPALLCALDHHSPLVQLQALQALRHLSAEATRTSLRRWSGPLLDALLKAVVAPEASLVQAATAAATAVVLQVASATDPASEPYHRLLPVLISGVSWRRSEPERAGPFLAALVPLLRAVREESLRYSKALIELLVEWLGSRDTVTVIRAAEALLELLKAAPERAPAHAKAAWPALSAAVLSASEAGATAPRRAAEARAALRACAVELVAKGGFGFGLAWRAQERSWAAAEGGTEAAGHAAELFAAMREAAAAGGDPVDEEAFRRKYAAQVEAWRAAAAGPAAAMDVPQGAVRAALRRRLEALSQLPWGEQDELEGRAGFTEAEHCPLHGRAAAEEAAAAEAERRAAAAAAQRAAKRAAADAAGPGAIAAEQAEEQWRTKAIAVTAAAGASEPGRGASQGRWWVGNPDGTQPALRAAESQVRVWDAASKAAAQAAAGSEESDERPGASAAARWGRALAEAEAAEAADALKRSGGTKQQHGPLPAAPPTPVAPGAVTEEAAARLARARKADELQRVRRGPAARGAPVSVEQLVMGAISVQMAATAAAASAAAASSRQGGDGGRDWGLIEGSSRELSLPVLPAEETLEGRGSGNGGAVAAPAADGTPQLLLTDAEPSAEDGAAGEDYGFDAADAAAAGAGADASIDGYLGDLAGDRRIGDSDEDDTFAGESLSAASASASAAERSVGAAAGAAGGQSSGGPGKKGSAAASPWEVIERLLLAEEESRDAAAASGAGSSGSSAAAASQSKAAAAVVAAAFSSEEPGVAGAAGAGMDSDTMAAVRAALEAEDSESLLGPPLPFASRQGDLP